MTFALKGLAYKSNIPLIFSENKEEKKEGEEAVKEGKEKKDEEKKTRSRSPRSRSHKKDQVLSLEKIKVRSLQSKFI